MKLSWSVPVTQEFYVMTYLLKTVLRTEQYFSYLMALFSYNSPKLQSVFQIEMTTGEKNKILS